MAHWREYLDSKTLGVGDMPADGGDLIARIKRVERGNVSYADGPRKQPMIHLDGVAKPLAAGATVCSSIAALYASDDPARWVGKLIALYPTKCKAKGELVDCLRVRPIKPLDDAAAPAFDLASVLTELAATRTLDELAAWRAALNTRKPPAAHRGVLKTAIDEHIALINSAGEVPA